MRSLFAGSERHICFVTDFRKQKAGCVLKNPVGNIFPFSGIFVAAFSITATVNYLKKAEFHVL